MRLNKRLQIGLLFTLYLCRSGRATSESAAEGLKVSRPFLEQVARSLRLGGVLRTVRGPGGGYEILGDPTVQEVFTAVAPLSLLTKKETADLSKGGSEHRALAHYVYNLGLAWAPLLRRKVRNVNNELVASEMAKLKRVSTTAQAH